MTFACSGVGEGVLALMAAWRFSGCRRVEERHKRANGYNGPDGHLYPDFNSLRHSYIALLDKSGATLKEAMQLARHSDPKLTMAVYGRAALHDLGAAVDRLPALTLPRPADPAEAAPALRVTGTEGQTSVSVARKV